MTKKSPGFWFFTGDWMKDPELRFCSLFARGLLVDLLCLMFEAKRCGYLCTPDGSPRSDESIVDAISGGSREEKLAALRELESSGVLSRDENGVLFSRRLSRLADLHELRKQSGSKGGSKKAANQKANDVANDLANEKQNGGVTDTVSDSDSSRKKKKTSSSKKKARPESVEEVAAYCKERGNSVDPVAWWDHYEAKGWKVGKTLMADWQAAVRTWERNSGHCIVEKAPSGPPRVLSRDELANWSPMGAEA